MSSYKLTRKAEADLESILAVSTDRFGPDAALRLLDNLQLRIEALARQDFDGPETYISTRARPVRRWPVPPFWVYYDRAGGLLRVLRIYHGARSSL